ncbi:MAG: hypothetical protein V4714_12765 [Bacteroidota bacterium]
MNTAPLFSKKQLKDLATYASFERGQEYYDEGAVQQVVRKGHLFEGKVIGATLYKVKLEMKGNNLHFHCSCPYDHNSICKHAVALGLAVMAGDYSKDTNNVEGEAEWSEAGFEDFFTQASQEVRNTFLRILLSKDENIRAQFVQFVRYQELEPGEPENEAAGMRAVGVAPLVNVDTIRDTIFQRLSDMSFDELDYDEYGQEYSYYVESWEQAQHIAEKMIDEVLAEYTEKAIVFIQKADLLNAFRVILGMYEGTIQVIEPASDDLCIFDGGGYNDAVMSQFDEQIGMLIEHINQIIPAEVVVMQVFDLLVNRFQKYANGDEIFTAEGQVLYNWKQFEPLLLSLLVSPVVAEHLLDLLKTNEAIDQSTAFVMLRIAELKRDEGLWCEVAENFAGLEKNIAQQLLEKYYVQGKMADFYRVATKMMKAYAHDFDQYILSTVTVEGNHALYLSALESVTKRLYSLEHYLELRNYWKPSQRNAFIDEVSKGYNHLFYMKLLETEERFDEILQLVKKVQSNGVSDFEKFLSPIVQLYPTDCFEIVVAKCEQELQSGGRGRYSYQQMAKWLKELTIVKSLEEEIKAYCLHLYTCKPILPALRDELKKIGLVR